MHTLGLPSAPAKGGKGQTIKKMTGLADEMQHLQIIVLHQSSFPDFDQSIVVIKDSITENAYKVVNSKENHLQF